MNLQKWFLRHRRVAVGIGLIIFSAFATSAKTVHTTPQPPEKILSLAEFSPAGDGVADDGPALQRALDALADEGGGTLLIPAGSYRIATPVVKDFSSVPGGKVTIQGVPSSKMPAPVTAQGNELAAGLDLTSEIIPATGSVQNAITISQLKEFTIEHVVFTGIESQLTDAFITLYLTDIDDATVRHCEFYGISSFGLVSGAGGGNVIRAERSELSVELSVFLGSTANSGAYAPLIENVEWRRVSVSNSIFLDYGLRTFFSKTGLGAPLSWIGIENPAPASPDSPRREVVVRDVFLDEGGWVGISVLPRRWALVPPPIDLIYISGLKMNVSNLHMTGHFVFDVRDVFIENSHYGWSHNAYAAIDLNRVDNAILDKLTCIDHANRLRTDDRMNRFTVINSVFDGIDSQAATITVLETAPEDDPVQYVRQRFVTTLGRPPDPAAHYYWSDQLIKCGNNNDCVNENRSALNQYLSNNPQETFSLAGTVTDENGGPVTGATISLTGSQSVNALTDSQGKFRFSKLPTSGVYTVAVNKRHYSFVNGNQAFVTPAADVSFDFEGELSRYSITGRITKVDGNGISGAAVHLAESPATTATTNANGFYSFPALAAGENYTVVPSFEEFVFVSVNPSVLDLSENRVVNFTGSLTSFSLAGNVTDEKGEPLTGATVNLSGTHSSSELTDSQGSFQFAGLPTGGNYTVSVNKEHYTFMNSSQTFVGPIDNVTVLFNARLNRHSITGRLTRTNGTGIGGAVLQLAEIPTTTATTDSNGFYSFNELTAGGKYTVVPSANDFVFAPLNITFNDLSADQAINFVGKLQPHLLMMDGSQFAVALDSVSFMTQPFSLFSSLGLSTDGVSRVMIFARNLEPVSGPSQVLVQAMDDSGQIYPLEVEFIGDVPGLSWLKQLNVKLNPNSLSDQCVQLRLTVAGVSSNETRVCIGNVAAQDSP